MASVVKNDNQHPMEHGIEELLGTGNEPCWLFDPIRSTLEAANAAGRRLLSLAIDAPMPLPLDSAMPALTRLREVHGSANVSESELLPFWISGRLIKLRASMTRVQAADGRTFVKAQGLPSGAGELSAAPSDGVDKTSSNRPEVAGDHAEAADAPAPRRTDSETLKEIARRIREGQGARPNQDPGPKSLATHGIKSKEGRQVELQPDTAPSEPATRQSLGRLAHELRTPISAIIAASEIMRDERLGPMGHSRYLDYAGDIHENARHALEVINVMLSGSTRDRETIAVSLDEIAEAAVVTLLPLADEAEVTLEFESDDGPLRILADPTSLRQIIFNLVSNALKFTPGGGQVYVVTGYLDDGSVYLVVRDTGQGMDEETITRAFFNDAAEPRPGGGYGMGLPLVRQLAETMAAALEVDSEPGKGTVVLLSFPQYHGPLP